MWVLIGCGDLVGCRFRFLVFWCGCRIGVQPEYKTRLDVFKSLGEELDVGTGYGCEPEEDRGSLLVGGR